MRNMIMAIPRIAKGVQWSFGSAWFMVRSIDVGQTERKQVMMGWNKVMGQMVRGLPRPKNQCLRKL